MQNLKLSNIENKQYLSNYSKFEKSNQTPLNEQICLKFMVDRCHIENLSAKQIFELSLKHSNEKGKIDQQAFLILQKYIAAVQKGMQLDFINVFELEFMDPLTIYSSKSKDEQKIQEVPKQQNSFNQPPAQNNIQIGEQKIIINILQDQDLKEEAKFDLNLQDDNYDQKFKNVNQPVIQKPQDKQIIASFGAQMNDDIILNDLQKSVNIFGSIIMGSFGGQKQNQLHNAEKKYKSVKINNFEEKKDGMLSKAYILYELHTKIKSSDIHIMRRYTDFENLSSYFMSNPLYQGKLLPQLPKKDYSVYSIFKNNQEFILQRKLDLEIYLQEILENLDLMNDEIFERFLTDQDFKSLDNYKTTYIGQVGAIYNNITSQSIYDLKDQGSAFVQQKYNQYLLENHQPQEMEELEKLINFITKEEQIVIISRDCLNQEMELENFQKDQINQMQQNLENIEQLDFHSINLFSQKLTDFNIQLKQGIIKKREVQINFKKLYSHIQSAKDAYNILKSIQADLEQRKILIDNKVATQKNEDQIEELQEQYKIKNESFKDQIQILEKELKTFSSNLQKHIRKTLEKYKQNEFESWNYIVSDDILHQKNIKY